MLGLARGIATHDNFYELESLAQAEELCGSPDDGHQASSSLPARIHFVWVGASLPEDAVLRMNDWASLNPSFKVFLWSGAPLGELVESDRTGELAALLDAASNPAAKSDVGRFAILCRFGGIYLDADMEACRPVGSLLRFRFGFVARESRWLIAASAIGLPKESAFGHAAIRVMLKAVSGDGVLDNFASGPPLITELCRAARLLGVDRPQVLSESAFFPDNPFRFPRGVRSRVPPFGYHLFDHSWSGGGELRLARRMVRAALQPILPKDVAIGKRRRIQRELRRLAVIELAASRSAQS